LQQAQISRAADAGGGRITSGSYFSSGSSSSSGGYGSNLVNPAACKQDVFNATLVGAGIGAAVGAYFGRSVPAAGLVAVVGGGLGMFYGMKTSPNCGPK
jgi:SAM-dependent MidA family methyltransferase